MNRDHWLVKNILGGVAFGVSSTVTFVGILIAWEHLDEWRKKLHNLITDASDDDDDDEDDDDDLFSDFDQMTEPRHSHRYHDLGNFPGSSEPDDAPLCTHGD